MSVYPWLLKVRQGMRSTGRVEKRYMYNVRTRTHDHQACRLHVGWCSATTESLLFSTLIITLHVLTDLFSPSFLSECNSMYMHVCRLV